MTQNIDINCSLGNWPFDKLKHNTPGGAVATHGFGGHR